MLTKEEILKMEELVKIVQKESPHLTEEEVALKVASIFMLNEMQEDMKHENDTHLGLS